MSLRIGRDVLNLRKAPRLGHTEYCSNWALIEKVSGLPKDDPRAMPVFRERFEFDFGWLTSHGPVSWAERGRVTDMGHAEWLADGSDRRDTIHCPFASVEDVYAFDAVKEYGLPDFAGLVDYYQETWRTNQKLFSETVMPGGYYRTIVSGAIAAFGWDMLLEAAADADRFDRVLDSIFRLSLHHYKAWAKTDIEFFISHDDMVWSQGAFMSPRFYRRSIFPRYRELWRVLKDAGKRVLFCSDANWSEFVDDIAAAGADGFIFEPMTALEPVVQKYGQTHVIISSKVDCRTLTFGTKEGIRAEVDATLALAKPCPGFVFAVGNHIPSNVPVENALFMFDYLRERWGR
ncbi:MAG TPA: uroporphyrinogen decarboxylase family protein [Candidatus Brocadiia bacterium]|nr:uroporphyrinogen decarboxylase family protein [Candidatus Brocadiia bacterium]